MATNDFLVFGGGASPNVIDQSAYAALASRLSGFQSGTASSAQLNKVWRQSSIASAVLAQFIVETTGQNAVDDGTTATLLANLKQAVAATVNFFGVNSSQKLNGVNSPNLLFNGSGEFGLAGGWGPGGALGAYSRGSAEGTYFSNSMAIGSNFYAGSDPVEIVGGVTLMLSGEVYAGGVTAGTAWFRLVFLDAARNVITTSQNIKATSGSGWVYGSSSVMTPAKTAYAYVQIGVEGTPPAVSVEGVAWRRLKLEKGLSPSLYSTEANFPRIALLDSPALTGMPTAPTTDAKDRSARIATTAFVRRALGSLAGEAWFSANTTLTAEQAGKSVLFNGNGLTFKLPPANSVEIGTLLWFVSQGVNNTVVRDGTDWINFGSNTFTSAAFQLNDNLVLQSDGDKTWVAVSGSVALPYSGTLADFVLRSAVPPGTMLTFGGNTVPAGYLLANGSAVSRAAYSALFSAIGTTYGAGDGSTTFNLPDARGVFLRGLDNGRGLDSGRALGSYQADKFASHSHAVIDSTHGHALYDPGHEHPTTGAFAGIGNVSGPLNNGGSYATGSNRSDRTYTNAVVQNSSSNISLGNTGANESAPKNMATNIIIKY
jgi:microcystin-dependent protein